MSRPVTWQCVMDMCPFLVWQVYSSPKNPMTVRRRRYCSLAGCIPAYLSVCPRETKAAGLCYALMNTSHKRTETSWIHCGRISVDDGHLVIILQEAGSFAIDVKQAMMMLFGFGFCPVYARVGEERVMRGYLFRSPGRWGCGLCIGGEEYVTPILLICRILSGGEGTTPVFRAVRYEGTSTCSSHLIF